jgi:hypothetical protein
MERLTMEGEPRANLIAYQERNIRLDKTLLNIMYVGGEFGSKCAMCGSGREVRKINPYRPQCINDKHKRWSLSIDRNSMKELFKEEFDLQFE